MADVDYKLLLTKYMMRVHLGSNGLAFVDRLPSQAPASAVINERVGITADDMAALREIEAAVPKMPVYREEDKAELGEF